MACCAFAVLIVSQILAAFGTVLRFAPWRAHGGPGGIASNPATAWQLHPVAATALVRVPRSRRRRPLRTAFVLALGIELAIGAGAAIGYRSHRAANPHTQLAGFDPTAFCRSTPAASSVTEVR